MSSGPALRYYGSLQGNWLGKLRFEVTDPDELRTRPLDKRTLGFASRFGSVWIATSLREEGPSEFLHTTRIFKWKLTLLATTERIHVATDERTLHMTGEQRPRFGRAQPYEAVGHVDEAAERATYRIPWAGEELVQRTHVVRDGLELVQETAWSRASVLLRRVSLGA